MIPGKPQATLSVVHLDVIRDDVRWGGVGYLACRDAASESDAQQTDALLIRFANGCGWGYEDLFRFVNSYKGRQFGDFMFSQPADVTEQFGHAVRAGLLLLPGSAWHTSSPSAQFLA